MSKTEPKAEELIKSRPADEDKQEGLKEDEK